MVLNAMLLLEKGSGVVGSTQEMITSGSKQGYTDMLLSLD